MVTHLSPLQSPSSPKNSSPAIALLSYPGISWGLGCSSGSDGKESAWNAGDPDSILGKEDPSDWHLHSSVLARRLPCRGTWRATVHEVAKSQTQLSDHHSNCSNYSVLIMWLTPSKLALPVVHSIQPGVPTPPDKYRQSKLLPIRYNNKNIAEIQ